MRRKSLMPVMPVIAVLLVLSVGLTGCLAGLKGKAAADYAKSTADEATRTVGTLAQLVDQANNDGLYTVDEYERRITRLKAARDTLYLYQKAHNDWIDYAAKLGEDDPDVRELAAARAKLAVTLVAIISVLLKEFSLDVGGKI